MALVAIGLNVISFCAIIDRVSSDRHNKQRVFSLVYIMFCVHVMYSVCSKLHLVQSMPIDN